MIRQAMPSSPSLMSQLPSPQVYRAAGPSIFEDYERLVGSVIDAIKTPAQTRKQWCELLPDLFTLRVRAIAPLSVTWRDHIEGIEVYYTRLLMQSVQPDSLAPLAKSIQFAVRTVIRSTEAFGRLDVPIALEEGGMKVPSYHDFIAMLAVVPNAQPLLDWMNNSMMIEFGIIAFDGLLQPNAVQPDEDGVNELCYIVNEAARKYSVAARQLGLTSKRSTRPLPDFGPISAEDLVEEKVLAQSGFEDFAASFN